jgi:hypothetical protein
VEVGRSEGFGQPIPFELHFPVLLMVSFNAVFPGKGQICDSTREKLAISTHGSTLLFRWYRAVESRRCRSAQHLGTLYCWMCVLGRSEPQLNCASMHNGASTAFHVYMVCRERYSIISYKSINVAFAIIKCTRLSPLLLTCCHSHGNLYAVKNAVMWRPTVTNADIELPSLRINASCVAAKMERRSVLYSFSLHSH